MKGVTRVLGLGMFLVSLSAVSTQALGDGLLEGMADGVNECYDSVSKAVTDLGQRMESNLRPGFEAFGEQVNRSVTGLLDGVAKAVTKAKENLRSDPSDS